MKTFIAVLLFLILFGQFCYASPNATDGSVLRRAEIYVDEDLYKDSEVLAAVQKYARAVEKNFNIKIDIKSFPVAFVLDSSTLNSNSPSFKIKTSAAELKTAIKKSWEDKSKEPLAGVILMGNLPFAEMEYFVKVSDGRFAYPEDEGPYTNYQRWVADFYFMDMDGEWRDEITGINCENRGKCDRLERGANGILDAHYDKNGKLGSDDFEIWVSRVNPYGEAREHTASKWKNQLQNYDTEYFPKVKELMLHWLSKAYNQQVKTNRPDKALYTYSSKVDLLSSDFSMENYIDNLSNIYNEVDVMWEADNRKYLDFIAKDYSITSDEKIAYINYIHVSNGTINQSFTIEYKKKLEETDEELLQLGIVELRERFKSDAKEIIVPQNLETELEGITFTIPQRGDKKTLLDLSIMNGKQYKFDRLKQAEKLNPEQKQTRLMKELQDKLHLPTMPYQIECFDNSNISGTDAVAA